MNRQFMSFLDGTSQASSRPLDDDDRIDTDLLDRLDRWGDRRVPKRDDDRQHPTEF